MCNTQDIVKKIPLGFPGLWQTMFLLSILHQEVKDRHVHLGHTMSLMAMLIDMILFRVFGVILLNKWNWNLHIIGKCVVSRWSLTLSKFSFFLSGGIDEFLQCFYGWDLIYARVQMANGIQKWINNPWRSSSGSWLIRTPREYAIVSILTECPY